MHDATAGRRGHWQCFWVAMAASSASILSSAIAADLLRQADLHSVAALAETAGLLIFSVCLKAAWLSAAEVRPNLLAPALRLGLAVSVVGVAVLY